MLQFGGIWYTYFLTTIWVVKFRLQVTCIFSLKDSLNTVEALIDVSVKDAKTYEKFQFERNGFFSADPDSTPGKVRIKTMILIPTNWRQNENWDVGQLDKSSRRIFSWPRLFCVVPMGTGKWENIFSHGKIGEFWTDWIFFPKHWKSEGILASFFRGVSGFLIEVYLEKVLVNGKNNLYQGFT